MTTTDAPRLDEINLVDPELYEQGLPIEQWRLLRRYAPVRWSPRYRQWPAHYDITRYADIIRISRDPQTFSSAEGITASADPENPNPEDGRGVIMIATDPPRHVRLRRLVNKSFTPRAVAQLEPHVRRIVDRIIDNVADRTSCDFVTEMAALLPLAVICDMVGVPEEEWGHMFALTNKSLGPDDPEYQIAGTDARETSNIARREMFGVFRNLIAERAGRPREDLMSVLLGARIDDDRLTDDEILYFLFLLIVAGNETTRNATTGGLQAMLELGDSWERLQRDPSLLPTAVEEVLRWTSPVMHMARFATRDVEIRDVTIRRGEKIIMWYPSANRDEEVFPNGDVFDIARQPNDHLAFGIGEHFCLGASLARLELRVMYERLLQRMPEIELAGPPQRLRSNFIGGIKHMPIRYRVRG
jgi:cholest-4-en-3-one 26-monooxygenase